MYINRYQIRFNSVYPPTLNHTIPLITQILSSIKYKLTSYTFSKTIHQFVYIFFFLISTPQNRILKMIKLQLILYCVSFIFIFLFFNMHISWEIFFLKISDFTSVFFMIPNASQSEFVFQEETERKKITFYVCFFQPKLNLDIDLQLKCQKIAQIL